MAEEALFMGEGAARGNTPPRHKALGLRSEYGTPFDLYVIASPRTGVTEKAGAGLQGRPWVPFAFPSK